MDRRTRRRLFQEQVTAVMTPADRQNDRDGDQILEDRQQPGPAQGLHPLQVKIDQQFVIVLDDPHQGKER